MDSLKLVIPSLDDEKEVLAYRQEFLASGDVIHGSSSLGDIADFELWLERLLNNMNEETVEKDYVPATTYLAIRRRDNRMVGIIQVRHRLNDHLAAWGGHIGYSVRPSERRKGYAKEILRLALGECREFGLSKVLLTCDKDNIGSAKTILANGGQLFDEIEAEGRMTQRYWIQL